MSRAFLVALASAVAGCSAAATVDAGTHGDAGTADAGRDGGDASAPLDAGTDATDAGTPIDAAADAADGAVVYASWHACGWSSSATDPSVACLCDGMRDCTAVSGGTFAPLGSSQERVCAADATSCLIVEFRETEGGGVARRCTVPRAMTGCGSALLDEWCQVLFTCNLLMGDCPPDVTPGGPVIACR